MIVLPWPDKRLSPNARLHWRSKVGPKQSAKRIAAWTTTATPGFYETRAALRQDESRTPIKVTFYPPDARRRDDDNMVGSFKTARDGIADAFGIDDRRFQPEYHFAAPQKPGRVVVEINPHPVDFSVACDGDSTASNSSPLSRRGQ